MVFRFNRKITIDSMTALPRCARDALSFDMPSPSGEPDARAPIDDPYLRAPQKPASARWRWFFLAFFVVLSGTAVAIVLGVRSWLAPPPPSVITVRPSPNVLLAVRDLARLETAEVHVEKVVDLTDQQSRMFGLIEATDAILLVAVGRATLGVDLSKVGDGDVSMDEASKTARLRLPPIELLQAGLDEGATYVYTRSTSLLARRNEQLESAARREAVESIKKAALAPDMVARAKAQAEKQLRTLITQLGAERVEITWRD